MAPALVAAAPTPERSLRCLAEPAELRGDFGVIN